MKMKVVAVLNAVELSAPEFLIRDEHCVTTRREERISLQLMIHLHSCKYSLRFFGIAGENVPFIYTNDTSKMLAERIVLYITCVLLHSLLCERAPAKQVVFAASQ